MSIYIWVRNIHIACCIHFFAMTRGPATGALQFAILIDSVRLPNLFGSSAQASVVFWWKASRLIFTVFRVRLSFLTYSESLIAYLVCHKSICHSFVCSLLQCKSRRVIIIVHYRLFISHRTESNLIEKSSQICESKRIDFSFEMNSTTSRLYQKASAPGITCCEFDAVVVVPTVL